MQASITHRLIESTKPKAKPFEIRDNKTIGFIVRVQPSGRMSYVVEYARGRRITIGKAGVLTPTQARNKAIEILGQVAQGHDPAAEKRKQKSATLSAFIENEYRPWTKANRKRGDEFCNRVLRVFKPLADKPLTAINAHQIEKVRTARLNSGISPSTINRDLMCLRAALSFAVRAKFLDTHPMADVKLSDVDASPKVRYLSDDESKRLRAALVARDNGIREGRNRGNEWRRRRGYDAMPDIAMDAYGDHLTPLVLLALNTGARRGELFSLEWADVDFDLKQITITGATSKRNRTRHIPLNAEALDTLQRWRKQSTDRLVFAGRDGERLNNVTKAWAGLMKDADITGFRWHDMRHTFASWLVMRGVDLNTVRELLGHGDIKMTLRYAHLAPAHKAEAVARLM